MAAGYGLPCCTVEARVSRPCHKIAFAYGYGHLAMTSISSRELRLLEADVSRRLPNWRLVYDNDLLAAARDMGLLDDDDGEDYDELDFGDEAATWRRMAAEDDEEEESDG